MPTKRSLKYSFRNSKLTGQLSVVLFSLLFLAVVATLGVVIFGKVTGGVKKSVLASQTVRLNAVADVAVSPLAPTANTGSSHILELKRVGETWNDNFAPYSHALIKFDLSQIPDGATITEAKLKLYVNSLVVSGPSDARVGLYAGKTSSFWGENTVNYRNSPGTDGYTAEAYYLPTEYTGLVTLDVTSHVTDWLSGDYPNDGFFVYSDVIGNSYDMKLASREAGSAGPLLGIIYDTSGLPITRYPSFNSDLLGQLMNFTNAYQSGQTPDFAGLADLFSNNDWEQAMRDFMSQFENFTPPDPTDSIPPNGGLPTGLGGLGQSGGSGQSGGASGTGSGTNTGQSRDCVTLAMTSQPSVSHITDTGAVISWQTDHPSDSYVFYTTVSTNSTNPSDYQGMGFSDTGVTNHLVTLSGLLPDTQYFYRAGSTCVGDVFAMSDATLRFYTTGGAGTTSSDANGGDLIDGGAVPPPGWRQDLQDHGASLTTGAGNSGTSTSNGSNESNGSNTTSGRLAGSIDPVSGHAIPSFGSSRGTSSTNSGGLARFLPFIIGGIVIGGALLTVLVIVLVLILRKKPQTASTKPLETSKAKAVIASKTSETSPTPKKSSSTGKIIAGCCGCGCLLLIFVFVILPLVMSFGPFTPFGFFSLFSGGL